MYKFLPILVVLILCLGWGNAVADELEELRLQLMEAKELVAQVREEAALAERERQEKERQIVELRSRYASLLMATDQALENWSRMELSAAHLVRNAEGEETESNNEAALMLEVLGVCRRRLSELANRMTVHQETLRAILEAANASEVIRSQAEQSLENLSTALEECLVPMDLATAEVATVVTGSCAILRLDAAAQLVILDQGTLQGIRVNQELTLQQEEVIVARLKVVVARPFHAAAVVVEGDFQTLTVGALLHRE